MNRLQPRISLASAARVRQTLDVVEKIFTVRKALLEYVDAEIARCGNPPNPAMVHSAVAQVLLHCQFEALRVIDAWVDAEIGKMKKEAK